LKTFSVRRIAEGIVLVGLLGYLPIFVQAQTAKPFPRNYFRWPLAIQPAIVANMGEMRNNHWHMGLDIRTNSQENLPVYAAAAGYISRIRVEKFGFGQCIYITHPNGYTTLYGHLNSFFPALEQYVREQQYHKESWAIELDFPKDKFPVGKGQLIAFSGNTGGSQGPHLHFEIRDTRTQTCLNPMLFGMPLPDQVKPSIHKLAMYDRRRSTYEQVTQFFPLKTTDSGYIPARSYLLKTSSPRVSFAIQAGDHLTGSKNEDGIFSARLFVDGRPVIGFSLDSISYTLTRYLNAHTDYKYHFNGGPFFQHLSQLPGEHSGVYEAMNGDGVIDLVDQQVHSIRIEVRDANNNPSQLRFQLQYDGSQMESKGLVSAAQKFIPNSVNVLERPGFELYLPPSCLYDTVTSFFNQVNDPSIPLHSEMTVRIKPDAAVPSNMRDRVVILRSYRNERSIRKADWNGEWLNAKFGDFGNFQAFIDNEAPSLNAPGSGDTIDLSPVNRIVFEPKDNFDVIRSFRAELDGKWLRFTNDKGRYYVYRFDEHWTNGVHTLKVTVEDAVGNITTRSWVTKKYPYNRALRPGVPPKRKVGTKGLRQKRLTPGKKSR
jgi:murein DD-endopeptidase MepM/ murein hydrolase activator NlpD